jgi:DNA uptake protein ComE-like DNA-binding protein
MKASIRWFAGAALLTMVAMAPLSAQVGKRLTIVDPNIATEAELQKVANLTPALVTGIIAKRPWLSQAALNTYLAATLTPAQLTETYKGIFLQLNLNSATREEILQIPGSGNRWAREFLEYRPYKSLAVFHREMSKYAKEDEVNRLEQYVFVPLDLNTATDSAFMTIPGVGKKMAYEFQEYRPWKSIEQFRREIGKYVKPPEVARLERYVAIPGVTP